MIRRYAVVVRWDNKDEVVARCFTRRAAESARAVEYHRLSHIYFPVPPKTLVVDLSDPHLRLPGEYLSDHGGRHVHS